MKHVPPELKFLVQSGRKIKQEIGRVSAPLLMRRLKITFEKASQVMQFIK